MLHDFFFFFLVLGFELRALCLLEPHPQPFFALVIFQIMSHIFAWGD
jgi:hypothetical protein